MTETKTDPLAELREACEYDAEGESTVDALIGYKDALEDRAYAAAAAVEHIDAAVKHIQDLVDEDDEYWSDLACGQDTEEAEASGYLVGQIAGLLAARAILVGEDPNQHLDTYSHKREEDVPLTLTSP